MVFVGGVRAGARLPRSAGGSRPRGRRRRGRRQAGGRGREEAAVPPGGRRGGGAPASSRRDLVVGSRGASGSRECTRPCQTRAGKFDDAGRGASHHGWVMEPGAAWAARPAPRFLRLLALLVGALGGGCATAPAARVPPGCRGGDGPGDGVELVVDCVSGGRRFVVRRGAGAPQRDVSGQAAVWGGVASGEAVEEGEGAGACAHLEWSARAGGERVWLREVAGCSEAEPPPGTVAWVAVEGEVAEACLKAPHRP